MSSPGDDPGSDAPLPSHPRRNDDADADISLERKRPRISNDGESSSKGSNDSASAVIVLDSPPIELVDDDSPQPSSQGSCFIMEDGLPFLLSTFPITDKQKPETPEQAAESLANDLYQGLDAEDYEILSLAQWFNLAADHIEDDPRHLEHHKFWFDIARIVDALLHRKVLGSGFPLEQMGDVLKAMCQGLASIVALFMKYEATNIERCVSRRDSVRVESGDADALYTPVLAICAPALNAVLRPKCELYAVLVKKNLLERFAIPPLAGKTFIEASNDLATLTDLFDKYVDNMTALEDPYFHLLALVEISSHLVDNSLKNARWQLSAVVLERIVHMFDVAYFTIFPKMMSIQPREMPGLHIQAVEIMQALVYCLCRDAEFAGSLFTKLNQRASQITSQAQGATEDAIDQTFKRCKGFERSCSSHLFELDMSINLVRSGIRDHRITGIGMSNSTLLEAYKEVGARKDESQIDQDPLCQTLALYCLRLNVVDAIFGPDSHADVIGQASRTVIFLLVTDHFTIAHLDKIWMKLSSSNQLDMTRACIHTLHALTSGYVTLEHVSHLLTRLGELQSLPDAMYCSWIAEMGKRTLKLTQEEIRIPMQIEIATKLVNLLGHYLSLGVTDNIELAVQCLLTFLGIVLDRIDQVSTCLLYTSPSPRD